jgi:hypothetical protein
VPLVAAFLAVKVALAPGLRRGRLLRPGAGGSPLPSFGRKLFMLAHASISVPSTEKCSSESSALTRCWFSTAAMNWTAISPAISRSRFFVNTVTSHTTASSDNPTNQQNTRL